MAYIFKDEKWSQVDQMHKYCLCIQTLQSHYAVQWEYSFSKHGQTHVDVWIYCTVSRKPHYCLQSFGEKLKNGESLSAGRRVACLSRLMMVLSSFVILSFLSCHSRMCIILCGATRVSWAIAVNIPTMVSAYTMHLNDLKWECVHVYTVSTAAQSRVFTGFTKSKMSGGKKKWRSYINFKEEQYDSNRKKLFRYPIFLEM